MKKTYGSEIVKCKHELKQERKQNTSTQEHTSKQQAEHLTERTNGDVVETTGHQINNTQRFNRRQ